MDMSSKLTNGLPHPHIMYDRTDYREYFQGGREELLRRAFADEADVEQVNVEEQLSGYSGAQTWRVSTNTGQIFIVKIAHPTIIAQENENYRRYVRGKLSNAAHALDKPFEATSGEWALLKYADVGEQSRTLLAFLEDNGSVDIAVILSDIFRVQGKWWAKDEPKLIRNCGYYYDRLLPEHFRLHELQIASDAPGIITPNLILKAGVVDQGSVAKLEATIEKSKRASLVIKL
jgi:hypothetical protein